MLHQNNASLRSLGRHYYQEYSCKTVSWDDVQRGTTVGGSLSFLGANIADSTRLWAKDGRSLFTVRSDNWNERLGKVTADDIAIVVNGGDATVNSREGGTKPITLRAFLRYPSRFGGYAGPKVAWTRKFRCDFRQPFSPWTKQSTPPSSLLPKLITIIRDPTIMHAIKFCFVTHKE